MPRKPRLRQITAVAATCALVGAGAGIAGTMAAPKSKKSSSGASQSQSNSNGANQRNRPPRPPMGGPGGFAVHAELVVPNRAGTGFETVVADSGKLKSVDGTTLTIVEGTDKAVYKTVDIDVGDSADVRRNHKTAKLSDLKADDIVHVVKDSKGYHVNAETAAFHKAERHRGPGGRGELGGPGAPGGPGGPPPGGPPPGLQQ